MLMLSLGSIAQGGSPPNPEDFEGYGVADPWATKLPPSPTRASTGWEVQEECPAPIGCSSTDYIDKTSILNDVGPNGAGDHALFAGGTGGGNISPRYYGAPPITPTTNNQTLKTDFRFTEDLGWAGGSRVRSRFGVGIHADTNIYAANFFIDTRDGILVADLIGGDGHPGPADTVAVPFGGLGVDDVRGPNSAWYTLFLNLNYPADEVRAKITTQDGVTDYGWSAPVPVGSAPGFGIFFLESEPATHPTNGRFLLNGLTYIDNVSWTAVPEPASLMLLAIGAAALARRRVA
jgi:hypothetical protein